MPNSGRSSIYLALVYDTLTSETFATIAELAARVRWRARQLHLPYAPEDIADAIAVAHLQSFLTVTGYRVPRAPAPDTPPLTRDDATVVLASLQTMLRHAPRQDPRV